MDELFRCTFIELGAASLNTITIMSAFTHTERQYSLCKSEKGMHLKEQQQQFAYYKKLSAAIINYEKVLLFGPTNAKL